MSIDDDSIGFVEDFLTRGDILLNKCGFGPMGLLHCGKTLWIDTSGPS
jgi:hypothetical protein